MNALDKLINECEDKNLAFEQEGSNRFKFSSQGFYYLEWSFPNIEQLVFLNFTNHTGWKQEAVGIWLNYIKNHCEEQGLDGMWIDDTEKLQIGMFPDLHFINNKHSDYCFIPYLPVNEQGREQAEFVLSTVDLMADAIQTIQEENEYAFSYSPSNTLEIAEKELLVKYEMLIRGKEEEVRFYANQKKVSLGKNNPRLVSFETEEEAKGCITEWILKVCKDLKKRETASSTRTHFDTMANRHKLASHTELIYAHLEKRYHFAEIEWHSHNNYESTFENECGVFYNVGNVLDTYYLLEPKKGCLLYLGENYEELKRVAMEEGVSEKEVEETIRKMESWFKKYKTL